VIADNSKEPPHSGTWDAWLDGYGTTHTDTLKVQILNSSGTVLTTLHTYSNLDHATGYTQRSFSLAPYIGQTVTLKFTGSEDSTLQTSFVIDDSALNVS
jgi:hypothetical protein